jgi:hypothetical protein
MPEASGPRSGPPGREKAGGLFLIRAKPTPTGTSEVLGKRHPIEGRQRKKERKKEGMIGDATYQMNCGIREKGRCPI